LHCDQIHPFLPDYAAGRLPGYRAAWVAAHIAQCEACRGALATHHLTAPEAASVVTPVDPTDQPRFVPRWYRWGVVILLSLLVALGISTVRTSLRRLAWRPAPTLALLERTPQATLSFQSAVVQASGVSVRVESITRELGAMRMQVEITGQAIYAPRIPETWVTVKNAQGQPLNATIVIARADLTGMTVYITAPMFDLGQSLSLQFSPIRQMAPLHWALPLPDPPSTLTNPALTLHGLPNQITLVTYGEVNSLLQVELVTASPEVTQIPILYLRDSNGVLFAPALQTRTNTQGEVGTVLRFPLPKELSLPLSLSGEGYLARTVGPWNLSVQLTK
jgi:hypothetical protein